MTSSLNKDNANKKGTSSGVKQKYDDDLLNSPNSKSMKNSLIYKIEQDSIINRKTNYLLKEGNIETKVPTVPIPRDGHSCCIFENKLVIFGGDRNKFPLNDLFTFNMD